MSEIIYSVQTSPLSTAHSTVDTKAKDVSVGVNATRHSVERVRTFRVIDGCCVWHWTDEMSTAEGWIVIDSPMPTASGGGLFLHQRATLEEVLDVARSMSAKLAVSCQPQIVGAKGGIRFPPDDPRAPLVLERFVRDNADVISQHWGTGGDINTDHAIIDKHARTYCTPGTSTALDALRGSLGCVGSTSSDIAHLLEEKVDDTGFSIEEFSVGYAMATALRELLAHTKPDLVGRARLVIQGFGCVGATFAHAARQLGIGRVVAISSQYGFLIDNDGIDCAAIDRVRRAAVKNPCRVGFDPRSLEAGLSQAELQSDRYTTRHAASTDEEHLVAFLAASRADVFVPCAQRYVLTPSAISALVHGTFAQTPPGDRFILAGANNVLDPSKSRDDILARLDSASVRMLPEWVSNSGTANLFMRACSGLALKNHGPSNLEASANDTKAFIKAVLSKVGHPQGNKAVWEACQDLAATRRDTGAVNLLGVKRMSHLVLNTFNAKRAIETVTRVYNAKSNKDGSLFQLPGPDDPTLSITQAPEGTSPADIGLSVRFSVYNLEKACEILEAERVTFKEQSLKDGSTELVLAREQAGYLMSLHQAPAQESSNASFVGPSDVLSSVVDSAYQLDHYASIMPNTTAIKAFHERMLGFTPIRTFTVNAGSAPEGQDDGLMHVMGLPFDSLRVVILTEGLTSDSVFSKLMTRKCGAYVHHIALEVQDVDAVFSEARERGWTTTSDEISLDLATGLRQFFLKEEEAGCILELIGRGHKSGDETAPVGVSLDSESANVDGDSEAIRQSNDAGGYSGQGEFRTGNIVALARSLDT